MSEGPAGGGDEAGGAHRSSCGRAARPSPGLGRDTGVQEPDVYEAQRTAHVGGHGWPGASLTFLWPPSVPAGGRGARRPSASSLLRRLPGGGDRNAVPSERPTSWNFPVLGPSQEPGRGRPELPSSAGAWRVVTRQEPGRRRAGRGLETQTCPARGRRGSVARRQTLRAVAPAPGLGEPGPPGARRSTPAGSESPCRRTPRTPWGSPSPGTPRVPSTPRRCCFPVSSHLGIRLPGTEGPRVSVG